VTPHAILTDPRQLKLLVRVLDELDRRVAIPGGAAREKLDAELLETLAALSEPTARTTQPLSEPPPRPIAVAMALTLFSQSHLVATFGSPTVGPESRPVQRPVLVPMDVMSDLLGLDKWELEELQGEIDRRVGLHLKQLRTASWLWTHFGLPNQGVAALVEVLFPGLRDVGTGRVGVSRRGGQLYALIHQIRSPQPESLYLSWLDREVQGAYSPRGTFSAHYVDRSLRRTICRSIGTTDDELVCLLDRMITVVPAGASTEFLREDRWRASGFDAITGLAGAYVRGADLTSPIEPGDIPFEAWIQAEGAALTITQPKALFDSVALDRVTEVSRQLHAQGLTSMLNLPLHGHPAHQEAELGRYHTSHHIKAVLKPLLDWVQNPETPRLIAAHFGTTPTAATAPLKLMAHSWAQHLGRSWAGPVTSGQPASVAVRLAAQLIATRSQLSRLWDRPPSYDMEHRDAALIFAGHYFAESPLDRLWGRDAQDLGEDPVGRWFWPCWTALLDHVEPDSIADITVHF